MSQASTPIGKWADLANPTRFVALVDRTVPWLAGLSAAILAIGLYLGFAAPEDYQQGTTVRIMYLHVPFAWLGMMCYTIMALAALGTLVWRHPLADVSLKAAAPIGAVFTGLALLTGSIWGKPMWGTWWVWDARLTSVFILFLMYLGIIALTRAIDDPARSARAAGRHHPGRLHQHPDHQVLGRLVEHAAPAGFGVPDRRADHPSEPAAAADRDGARLHAAVPDAAPDGDPHRDPAPPGRGDAADRGAPRRAQKLMSTHDLFVAAAYLLSAIGIAGLIGWILADQRARRRELAELEASGVRRRSERAGDAAQ